jgi:hypothetical protein
MSGVWAEISEDEIISADFVQGKKNHFLSFIHLWKKRNINSGLNNK